MAAELRSVWLAAGAGWALQDVSLPFYSGEVTAILGSAAGGKSSILRVLARKIQPSRGEVVSSCTVAAAIEGDDIPKRHGRTLAAALKSKSADAGLALDAVGLWDRRNTPFTSLTPAQRAAFNVARALNDCSDLTLLDTHVDLFDPDMLNHLWRELDRRAVRGLATVICTRRAEIAELAARVAILDSGHLVGYGRPIELAAGYGSSVTIEPMDKHRAVPLDGASDVDMLEDNDGFTVNLTSESERAAVLLREGLGTASIAIRHRATLADVWARLKRR